MKFIATVALTAGWCAGVRAQSGCSSVLMPTYTPPAVAPGWSAQLIANNLTTPRSMSFDSSGALLVVERGKGVSRITFKDNGGTCLQVATHDLIIANPKLNHGLAISDDSQTIYASSVESVFAYTYDSKAGTVSGNPREVIKGMSNNDLTTRTLVMSRKSSGYIIVSRGSSQDFDLDALNINTGLSQLKAFSLGNLSSSSPPYNFNTDGRRLGWGLRNAVGVGEHPISGGIYSLDQGVDGMTRSGQDIHENNPGEELNFHGYLNSSTDHQGGNYGYPSCFSVWDTAIPDNSGLVVGDQFPMAQNSTLNDVICENNFVGPRLTFPAHMSPLDIEFTADGTTAYITFHGSIDKTNPVGYSLSSISFNSVTGDPVAPIDSKTALSDILSNPDHTKCPSGCLRPAGLVVDSTGRLFMSGDSTGEIYVFSKSSSTPTSTTSGTIVTATGSPNSASTLWTRASATLGCGLATFALAFILG